MPIFEYYSPHTHRVYRFYARRAGEHSRTPRCPDGAQYTMERVMSAFSVTQGLTDADEPAQGPAQDTDTLTALQELEAALDADKDLPDEQARNPAQLAELAERFYERSGKAVPPVFAEMLARFAKGEDPLALQARYAQALEGEGWAQCPSPLRSLLRGEPAHDATLYELDEYCET